MLFPGDSDPQPRSSMSVTCGNRGAGQSWSWCQEHEGSKAASCLAKTNPASSGTPSAVSGLSTRGQPGKGPRQVISISKETLKDYQKKRPKGINYLIAGFHQSHNGI